MQVSMECIPSNISQNIEYLIANYCIILMLKSSNASQLAKSSPSGPDERVKITEANLMKKGHNHVVNWAELEHTFQ